MTDRNSGFKKDEIRNTDNGVAGDGCHNCYHHPKFVNMRTKVGKPKISTEVFEQQMAEFSHAYDIDIAEETYNVYWNHLAYTIMSEGEFKDVVYHCIDEYVEFPAIAQILEMSIRLKLLKEN